MDTFKNMFKDLSKIKFIDDRTVCELELLFRYSDMSSIEEKEMIELLKKKPWRKVVHETFVKKRNWLYRVISDSRRSAFLNVLPIKKGGTFLDVGAGWGQISIPLSHYGNVFALDLTLNRIEILKLISVQEEANLYYICGNVLTFPFKDNLFDLVIFNGTLEWVALGEPRLSIKETQQKALKKAFRWLTSNGILYIGIENSVGAKYLLGAPDDHTGLSYFTFLDEEGAIEKYRESKKTQLKVKTYSLTEYIELIENAGFKMESIYCCFPDYKIIQRMIDIDEIDKEFLKGVFYDEHSGIDGSALPFQKELRAIYKVLAKNGIAKYFCPSYGFVARK